jgi:hypothetical protein
MELTKEYFDQQLARFATKDDLLELAAKTDIDTISRRIDGLPAHDDLEPFATKDDLLELATKNDLGAVRSDITEVKQLVQRINEREDQDTRAVMRDVADLHRRVAALEQRPS